MNKLWTWFTVVGGLDTQIFLCHFILLCFCLLSFSMTGFHNFDEKYYSNFSLTNSYLWGTASAIFVFWSFGLFGKFSGRAGFCIFSNFCIFVFRFVGHCRGRTGFWDVCNFYIFVFRSVWEIAVRERGFATLYFCFSVCLGNCRGRAGCGGSRETDTGSSTRLFLCRGPVCKKYRSRLYLSDISYKNIVCNCNLNWKLYNV